MITHTWTNYKLIEHWIYNTIERKYQYYNNSNTFFNIADVMILLWHVSLGGGVSWIISATLRERIAKSLKFGILRIILDALSSVLWLTRYPLSSLPLVAVLFDLRLSGNAELMDFLTTSMALANLFWRELKVTNS